MNKIYKVVWSKVKNCYVVVSEIAKNVISGSVKSAKIGAAPVVKGMALGALMALVITGNAWAAGGYYNGHYYIFSNYKEFTENTSMSTWRALFTGDNEPGVYHTVNANGNTITLTGKISGSVPLNEYGFSYHGGIMRLYDASKIEFAGDYKSGIYAYVGNYAQFTDIGDIVQTSGSFSEGYFINNYGSTVEIDANNIDVNGGITSTYCDYTAQGVVYGTTDINVSENITLTGNINAYQQSTININANQSNITGDITSKSGSVVSITANTNNLTGNMHAEGENSRINITANSQGNVVGDVSALSGGGVSIDLAGSGSSFTGSSTTDDTNGGVVLDLTQGATWYVTGDSKVDSIIGDDFNIIAANGMKDINLTIECGNHNLDVDDYYDHTNSNLRGVNMFLVAPTEDGLTDGVSINSDSDVTVKSATEHGISINYGGKVDVNAADVNIDSFKAAIWIEKNGDELNKGEVYVNASGDVYLKSEDRFAINNESTNNGIVDVRGNNITIISESMPAIKVGETIYSEGYDGIIKISGEKITLKGASHEIVDGWQQRASVLYASGGTINVDAADRIMVTDTAKVGGNAVGAYNSGNINIKDAASVDVDGRVHAYGEGSKVDIANVGNVSVTSTSGSAINSASNNSTIKIGDAQTVKITGATQNLTEIKNANGETISYNEDNRAVVYAKGTVNIIATDKVEIVDNNEQKAVSAFGGANVTVDGGKETLIYGEINADGHEYVGQPGGRIEHQDNGIGEKINIAVNGNEIFIDAKGGEAVYARGDSIGGDEAIITIGDVDTEKVSITNTTNGLAAMYDGSKVKVNGEYLAINATSGDEDAGIGIYASNNDTVYSNPATVDVKTKKTKITVDDSGHAGIWARYHGVVNVDNGLEIQAKNAIIASGGAQVNINESGNGVVKIDGDVEFNNIGTDDNPNAGADNNHSGVNADININLSTADSYLKGNIFTTNGNHEKNLDFIKYVEGMNLSISNGATWETDASSFVNSLYVNGGNITVKNAHKGSVVVDEVTGNKVSVKVDELVDETVKFGTVADSVEVTLGVANGGDLGVDVKQGVQEYYDAVVDGTGKTAVDNISIEQFNLKAKLDITSDGVVTTIKPGDKFVVESDVVATGDVFAGDGSSIKGNASAIDKLDESLETKADRASTLAGYGITNAYTKTEMDEALAGKVDAGKATGTWAVAAGKYANAETNYSVAIGGSANAGADYSIAIGSGAETAGSYSVAIGNNADVTNYFSVGVGYRSEANYRAVAIGGYSTATGVYSVAVGEESYATGGYTVSIGTWSSAKDTYSIAIGNASLASNYGSIALGDTARSQHYGSVAIGKNSVTSDDNTVSFGHKIGDAKDMYSDGSGYKDDLYRRLTNVAYGIDDHDVVTVGQLNSVVSTKANVSDVYTKTEVDTALDGKADRADISVLDSQVEAFSTTRDEKGKVTGANITGTVNAHDFSAGNYTLRQVGSDLNTLDRLAIKNGQYMIDDRFDSLSMMSQSADMFYLTTENIDRTAYTSMGLEKGRFYISNHNIDGTAGAELYVSGTKVGVNGDFVVSDWNGKKFTVASNGKVTGGTYNGVEIKSVNNNAVIGGINLSTLATQQDTEALQGNIDAEIVNREVADTALEGRLNTKLGEVENAYQQADAALESKVTSAYQAADVALESKVTSAYNAADVALESKVTEAYKSADEVLSGRIDETQASIALKANIADVYTKTVADEKFAVKASTLAGYGITDAYTQAEVNAKIADATSGLLTDANLAGKADKADTLSGYGITDAYTKAEVDSEIVAINASVTEAYKSADIELEGRINAKLGEVENAYQAADIALESKVTSAYNAADVALESEVTEAYKSADEVLRSSYETADNALSGRIDEAQASIALKANIADVYTKTVADAKFAVKASTLAGYGITDAYTQAEVNAKIADATSGLLTDANLTGKADKADTLSGYGIADAYTKDEVNAKIADATSGLLTDANLEGKADKADTLSGYGITDAYTKAEVDSEIVAMNASVTEAYKSADTELEGRFDTKLGEVETAYQQADAALEGRLNTSISEVEFAYKQADEVILGNIAAMGKEYTDADVALERRVTVAYENADKALKSGYEAADNALRDYIDQKVNGIVTDANVSDLQNKTQNITAEAGKTFVDGEINTDSLIASGNVVANGSVIGSSVVSTGNVEASGDIITSNGDVKAGDVSLQNTANQVEANKVAIENVKTDLSAELDKKANASDVYTKAEADAIFVKQTAVKTEDEEGNTTITTDTVVKQNVVEVKDVDGNITTTTKTEIDNNFVVEGSDKGAEVSINKDTDSQVIIGADGKMIFGTNSTAIDKHGVYAGRIDETGDHDYANAKAAINDEGEVKAASGKFTVDKDGNVNATSYNGINLEQFVNNSQEAISGLNQRLGQMNGKINKVGAGAAALAALHPLEYDPDDKLTFSAGVGNYAGENAAALGAFYRPDEKLMFSIGGTMGNGENMVNLGVSIGLDGAKGTPKLSRKELVQIVAAMHAESKEIKTENEAIKAENVALEERVAKLEALVAKLAEK